MVSNKFLAAVAAFVFAAGAQAAPLELNSNFANGHFAAGNSKSFEINVNNLLAGKQLNSASIIGGQLTIYGFSAATTSYYQGYTFEGREKIGSEWRSKPGNCNKGPCTVEDETWLDSYTYHYVDGIADTMQVKVGDTTGSDSTDWLFDVTGAYGSNKANGHSGNQHSGWDYYEYRTRNSIDGYSGALSVTLSLDSKALTDITKDGILGLSIWNTWGQFDISSFSLNLLAQDKPLPPAEAQVPVPTSLLLTGLGLAALGTMRRRRKA